MIDEKLVIVQAKYPKDFTEAVNQLLSEGSWRVVQTEMSVTDHHYYAMLIKQKQDNES